MNNLGIYLHYPFCRRKCLYCDFYSCTALSLRERYEAALVRAITQLSEGEEREVESVYFGGGTPSLCTPFGLREIFSALYRSFCISSQAEITLEMNPESANEEILSTARSDGVNRISFGMQSAVDAELAAIGRLHRAENVREAVSLARACGFDNVSLDLMYGLPAQTLPSLMKSVDEALSLGVSHVSFYCLTLSESVPLYAVSDTLPDEEAVREMYFAILDRLGRAGFEQYEISNAARDGAYSRHNLRYWQGGDYLGIGPSAHSLYRSHRFAMSDRLEDFLSADRACDCIVSREKLGRDALRTEYLMLSLRTVRGLSWSRLAELSDDAFCRRVQQKIPALIRGGLARPTESGFALTPEGFFVSNEILTQLI